MAADVGSSLPVVRYVGRGPDARAAAATALGKLLHSTSRKSFRMYRTPQMVRWIGSQLAYSALALACLTSSEATAAEREEIGLASYYSRGQRTASGEPFVRNDLTGAHRTLPFGTRVRGGWLV
jgi:rare lipoprotein A (peptidoglycan hydrolase)